MALRVLEGFFDPRREFLSVPERHDSVESTCMQQIAEHQGLSYNAKHVCSASFTVTQSERSELNVNLIAIFRQRDSKIGDLWLASNSDSRIDFDDKPSSCESRGMSQDMSSLSIGLFISKTTNKILTIGDRRHSLNVRSHLAKRKACPWCPIEQGHHHGMPDLAAI